MLNLLRGRKTYKVRREDPEIDFKKLFRFTPESVSWLSEHFWRMVKKLAVAHWTQELK
nr:unnamed protein product [Callosobruchus chinensis]